MERLTHKQGESYSVCDTEKAILQLAKYENMYFALQAELYATLEKLETMSAQGKSKSTTYIQLLTTKLTLKDLIGRIEIYVR